MKWVEVKDGVWVNIELAWAYQKGWLDFGNGKGFEVDPERVEAVINPDPRRDWKSYTLDRKGLQR